MALDSSKKGFGFDVGERLKNIADPHTHDDKHEHEDVSTHKDTHTHTHDDTDVYEQTTVKKTTKNKRIQILTYSALVRKMDNYAKRNGLSRAEVFEKAVSEFLERNT